MKTVGLLKGCDHTQKPNLKKGSIGENRNPIGKKAGLKTNMSKTTVPHQKLLEISVLLMRQLYSGFVSTISPEGRPRKPDKLRSGGLQAKITECLEEQERKVHDGREDVLEKGSRFIHHLNGLLLCPLSGKKTIINAVIAGYRNEKCTFITLFLSLSKKKEQNSLTLSSFAQNVIGSFTAKRMLKGCF